MTDKDTQQTAKNIIVTALLGSVAPYSTYPLAKIQPTTDYYRLLAKEILPEGAKIPKFVEGFVGASFYDPARHLIMSDIRFPATVAHELGHAIKGRSLFKFYSPSRVYTLTMFPLIAGYLGMKASPENIKKYLLLASLPSIPMLAEEARASIVGMKGLLNLARKGVVPEITKGLVLRSIPSLLSAWSTYFLSAGLPLGIGLIARKLHQQAQTEYQRYIKQPAP